MHFPSLILKKVYNFRIWRSINLGIRIHIIPMITNNYGEVIRSYTQQPGCRILGLCSTLIMDHKNDSSKNSKSQMLVKKLEEGTKKDAQNQKVNG